MEVLVQNVDKVINKLILAQNIYEKAAKKVHFEPMQRFFKDLKLEKMHLLGALANHAEIDLSNHEIGVLNIIKLELEKMGLEVDHLLIKNNYNETLSFCIKRESELLEAYEGAIEENFYDVSLCNLLNRQKAKTRELLAKLEIRHRAGDFKNW